MKNEDVSVLKLIIGQTGNKDISLCFCPNATIKLHFSELEPHAIRKIHSFFKVCKRDMLNVNFYWLEVYHSVTMESGHSCSNKE